MTSARELMLLHGWGLQRAVWAPVLPLLAAAVHARALDLPGHGAAAMTTPYTLNALAQAMLAQQTAARACWLGWSLGGLVALAAAQAAPARVEKLILVATTPRFVQAGDWPWAMPATQLQQFARGLAADYANTVLRFLSLQVSAEERPTLRALRTAATQAPPQPAALHAGLELLAATDLRASLAHIAQPVLIVHGTRDTLARPQAAEALAAALPRAELRLIEGAGHAPFLSHPAAFAAAVNDFLAD